MSAKLLIGGAASFAALLLLLKPKAPPAATQVKAEAPPNDAEAINAGGVHMTKAVPPAPVGLPPVKFPVEETLKNLGGGTAATIIGGIKFNNAVGEITEKFAGKGAGDLARVNALTGLGSVTKVATQQVLAKVGLPEPVQKHVSMTVGAAAVVGLPAAIAAKVTGEAASKLVRLVAGQKAETAVRSVAKQFDPTSSKSIANKVVVKPIAGAVKAIGGLFKKGK